MAESGAKQAADTTKIGQQAVDIDGAGWRQSDILRALHRHETSLKSRLQSIEADTESALTLYAALQTALPLFANARAGSWYVPPEVDGRPTYVAAFKSADGHFGTWSLSLRRPNLHVFRIALRSRGAVLFDVTRAGKRFPDALTRTVPIWCAAMSLLAGLIQCTCTTTCCVDCVDRALHLPPSVLNSERDTIAALMPVWLAAWKPAESHIRSIAVQVEDGVPLRPLWLAPDRNVWDDGLPSSEELGFVPIVCVSVSPPSSASRKERPGRSAATEVMGVHFPARAASYVHVQGAGDDEETWARLLTPALFWQTRDRILAGFAGDAAAENIVHAIVAAAAAAPPAPCVADIGSLASTGLTLRSNDADTVAVVASAAGLHFDVVVVLGEPMPIYETLLAEKNQARVLYFALRDSRNRPDHKHALCRALGAMLQALRSAAGSACVFGVGKHGKDASTAVAVAWVSWHCDVESLTILPEYRARESIDKSLIQSAMLAVLGAQADLSLSRAALLQITRFFLSPNPPTYHESEST